MRITLSHKLTKKHSSAILLLKKYLAVYLDSLQNKTILLRLLSLFGVVSDYVLRKPSKLFPWLESNKQYSTNADSTDFPSIFWDFPILSPQTPSSNFTDLPTEIRGLFRSESNLVVAGFERVAEELMGRRQWRAYQERVLRSWCPSIERDIEIKDWDPTEDKCNFCDLETTGRDTDEGTVSHFIYL